MAKKIIVLASFALSLTNFRYPLLKQMVLDGYEVVACAPEDEHLEFVVGELEKISVDFVAVPLQNTSINFIQDFFSLIKMVGLFRRLKADYLLSYTIKPVIYGSIAARLAGIKRVASIITGLGTVFIAKGLKAQVLRGLVKCLYRLALSFNAIVFFQNPDDQKLFVDSKLVSKNKTRRVYGSGVDLSYYPRVTTRNKKCFLLIARLIKDKGIAEYLAAAREIKAADPTIVFHLVGGSYPSPASIQQEELQEYIDDGIVTYHGELSDVRPMLAQCWAYVLPSYREGTPRSVLEAMATGRPIITTDAPGCRETVVDGKTGYLVAPGSVDSLVEGMRRMLSLSDSGYEKMAEASYQLAKKHYDVNSVNANILAALL